MRIKRKIKIPKISKTFTNSCWLKIYRKQILMLAIKIMKHKEISKMLEIKIKSRSSLR